MQLECVCIVFGIGYIRLCDSTTFAALAGRPRPLHCCRLYSFWNRLSASVDNSGSDSRWQQRQRQQVAAAVAAAAGGRQQQQQWRRGGRRHRGDLSAGCPGFSSGDPGAPMAFLAPTYPPHFCRLTISFAPPSPPPARALLDYTCYHVLDIPYSLPSTPWLQPPPPVAHCSPSHLSRAAALPPSPPQHAHALTAHLIMMKCLCAPSDPPTRLIHYPFSPVAVVAPSLPLLPPPTPPTRAPAACRRVACRRGSPPPRMVLPKRAESGASETHAGPPASRRPSRWRIRSRCRCTQPACRPRRGRTRLPTLKSPRHWTLSPHAAVTQPQCWRRRWRAAREAQARGARARHMRPRCRQQAQRPGRCQHPPSESGASETHAGPPASRRPSRWRIRSRCRCTQPACRPRRGRTRLPTLKSPRHWTLSPHAAVTQPQCWRRRWRAAREAQARGARARHMRPRCRQQAQRPGRCHGMPAARHRPLGLLPSTYRRCPPPATAASDATGHGPPAAATAPAAELARGRAHAPVTTWRARWRAPGNVLQVDPCPPAAQHPTT